MGVKFPGKKPYITLEWSLIWYRSIKLPFSIFFCDILIDEFHIYVKQKDAISTRLPLNRERLALKRIRESACLEKRQFL